MGYESVDAVVSRLMNDMIAVYDDTRLNKRLVTGKVMVARANVLSKYLRQHLGTIPGQYYNECCFDVKCEPICPGAPILVYRGTIPNILGQLGRKGIKYLGTIDGKNNFDWRDETSNNFLDYSTFVLTRPAEGTKNPWFTLTGNKVTVYDRPTDDMTTFYIRGIFSDPFACNCPTDSIFIPEDHIDEVEQQIKIDLSTFLMQRRIDKYNNANSDN
jgi:hypothetical protein